MGNSYVLHGQYSFNVLHMRICESRCVAKYTYLTWRNRYTYEPVHIAYIYIKRNEKTNVRRLIAFYCFYYPRPDLAFGYCRWLRLSVCVCGNHLLVRAIICYPFKLESPNLDQKGKTPWLTSLLFLGVIDLELQGQIKFKSKKMPYFEPVLAIIRHLSKIRFPNFDSNSTLALLRSLLILGLIDIVFQSQF